MCGIAGLLTLNPSIDPQILSHFQKTLSHRGPDDEGTFQKRSPQKTKELPPDPSVLLFHRRLSIVDITHGHQPFITPLPNHGCIALIVNGEIYNSNALREKYASFPFQTSSDCEVLLPLYLEHGPQFLSHLQGMYAFALYDSRSQSLILGRDPFGMKPLYIRKLGSSVAFASEIPALSFPFLPNPLNPNAQSEALHRQYTSKDRTLFQEITRVLPGQTLVVDPQLLITRSLTPALEISPPAGSKIMGISKSPLSTLVATFESLLLETVESHLLSDVPVGLFYSGGVDSSIILKALNLLGHTSIPSFHIRFEGDPSSFKEDFPLKAHLTELSFTEEDFWNLLPLGAFVMDDFAADYAVLPTLKLAQAAKKENIPVILSGEGGDEVFAGYGRYRQSISYWPWRRALFRHKSLLYNLPISPHLEWYHALLKEEHSIQKSGLTPLQKTQLMDLTTWLPDDLMIKLDRTLMHYGLEGRPPFLDKTMANFGFKLPKKFKVRRKDGKWLLKYWLSCVEPSLNFFVKKKGFSPPVHQWLSRKTPYLKQVLPHQDALIPFLPPHHTLHLLDRLSSGKEDKKSGLAVWILLFYTLWYKIHVQGYCHSESVFDLLEKP